MTLITAEDLARLNTETNGPGTLTAKKYAERMGTSMEALGDLISGLTTSCLLATTARMLQGEGIEDALSAALVNLCGSTLALGWEMHRQYGEKPTEVEAT